MNTFIERKFLLAVISTAILTEAYWRILERIIDKVICEDDKDDSN